MAIQATERRGRDVGDTGVAECHLALIGQVAVPVQRRACGGDRWIPGRQRAHPEVQGSDPRQRGVLRQYLSCHVMCCTDVATRM